MTPPEALLLSASSVAAGLINSVAGGGSFFTFPALVFCGVPSIAANATSTMAVWPGTLASIGAYRKDIRRECHLVPRLLAVSLVGGLVGAFILLKTPQSTFDRVVPWLMAAGTAIFALGDRLARRLRARDQTSEAPVRMGLGPVLAQFIIATYAGYFGGGAGLLVLALLSLAGMMDIHAMNGLKTLLGAAANFVAILAFVADGLVVWNAALIMMVGAVAGGYGGASLARRANPKKIRALVIAVGAAMTVYFFLRRR